MGIRILLYRIGIFILLREIQYTASQMRQEPLAAPYVPLYQSLRATWMEVLLEEIDILDELSEAQAAVTKADNAIDVFSGRVSRSVDEHTDGKTRKQIRLALFKNKTLAKFRRPVLGGQLLVFAEWSVTLAKCGVPALITMAPDAAALAEVGKSAEALLATAKKRNRDFRDVGTRKQFIDKVNGTRKETHGLLGKMPFENPALPQDFAGTFFLKEEPRAQEETIDEVRSSIDDLNAELVARHAQLTELEAEALAEEQAALKNAANDKEIADIEAQVKELQQKAADLKKNRDE
jgi:hypothetical protein